MIKILKEFLTVIWEDVSMIIWYLAYAIYTVGRVLVIIGFGVLIVLFSPLIAAWVYHMEQEEGGN